MSIQLARALAVAANAVAGGDEMTDTALPSGARLGLETRCRELTTALEMPRADKVRGIVAQLATMPSRGEDDPAKRRMAFEQYLAICSDVPEWALEWAVWSFLKHDAQAEGAPFRPTAGELRAFAMRRVSDVAAERDKIATVLRAKIAPPGKPIDAERRKEFAEMVRGAIRRGEPLPDQAG